MGSNSITFRAETKLSEDLEKLAEATDRSKSWHVEQAVKTYLAQQSWQIGRIEEGLADLSAGRVVDHDKVSNWLNSWGQKKERKSPL